MKNIDLVNKTAGIYDGQNDGKENNDINFSVTINKGDDEK